MTNFAASSKDRNARSRAIAVTAYRTTADARSCSTWAKSKNFSNQERKKNA